MAFFLAMTLSFALLDTLAKVLTRELPVVQIVWGRYVFHIVLLAVFLLPRMGWRLVVSRRPALQLARSALIALITVLFVTTLVHLPLVDVTAIGYVSPLAVTALGALILGERVGLRRWTAVLIGFLGVLIIVRPGFAEPHWSIALAVFVPVLNAGYHIVTRLIAGIDAPMTSLFYSGIVGAVGMSLIVPFVWVPLGVAGWAGLVGLGVFGGAGHYFMIRAYDLAPASMLAPLTYVQLVWVAGLGFAAFGDVPGPFTIAGAVVIVACGLYVIQRERQGSSGP